MKKQQNFTWILPTTTWPQRLTESCKTNFCLPVKILHKTTRHLICFQDNCVGASAKKKLQKKKHYRGHFPYDVFFWVVLPAFSSPIPAPCIHKIPVILGSFAFCRENNRRWEKDDAGFFCFYREVKNTEKEDWRLLNSMNRNSKSGRCSARHH